MAKETTENEPRTGDQPTVTDAVRHVGKTLEAEGVFLPTGELPENTIADEGLVEDTHNLRAATADQYDLEAEAMGAEPLRTRLPGDTSSEPHTNVGPDNATTVDDDRPRGGHHRAA